MFFRWYRIENFRKTKKCMELVSSEAREVQFNQLPVYYVSGRNISREIQFSGYVK